MADPAGPLGHRDRPGPGRHQAHRRGLGRRRAVPGRQLRRRSLVGVERPIPRRRARLRQGRPRHGRAIGQRFLGSPDIYGHKHREPGASINFVTCHDGFTLNDLVSYDAKHNEANGEENRDGNDQNLSWNCGVEGPDRRPRRRGAAAPPGQERPGHRPAGGGHADAADGRRGPAHAGRQQQRLLPRRRHELVRLGRTWSGTPTSCGFTRGLIRLREAYRRGPRRPGGGGAAGPARGRLDRAERHSGRRAGPGGRLAQRRADDPLRSRGAPSHPQRLLGRPRLRAADPRRERRSAGIASSTPSLDSPDDLVLDYAEAPTVDGSTYRSGPRSVVLLAARRVADDAPRKRRS